MTMITAAGLKTALALDKLPHLLLDEVASIK
jgi:hypothetical protein